MTLSNDNITWQEPLIPTSKKQIENILLPDITRYSWKLIMQENMSNLTLSGETPSPFPTRALLSVQFFINRKPAYHAKPSSLPLFYVPINGTIHPNMQPRNLEDILVTTLPHNFSLIKR